MAKSGNQAIQDTAKNEQKREYEKGIRAYLETFSTETGRAVLADMRKRYCGSFDGKKEEDLAMAVGKREVVKDIEAMLIIGGRPDIVESMFKVEEFNLFE